MQLNPGSSAFTSTRRGGLSVRATRNITIGLFLLPALLVYTGFVIWPIVQAAIFSTYRWNGLGPIADFRGLDNFQRILGDDVFVRALSHTLLIASLSVFAQLPVALGLALLVNTKLRGRAAFRVVFFLPFVLSEVITGLIWTFIYRIQGGLLNTIIGAVVPSFEAKAWLGETDIVMVAVFVALTWKFFGYYIVLFLAGLQNIPHELHEAAKVDGATGAQALRFVTVPLLGPTIRLTVYIAVIGSLQVFDLVWVLTQGGPVSSSETMATYLYRFGFQRFQLGYGSAVALLMFLMCFAFSLIYQRFVMRRDLA